MPTDKQRDANKRNAQKSTGPRTEEGKRKSSLNGLRHGLFAKNYTMTPDEKIEHGRLLEAYIGHFRPEDPITLDLVEELAMAKMRQKRAWALESDLLRIELIRQRESHDQDFPDEKIEGRLALALEWLVDESNALETVRRYEGQLHRAWHKCLAQLERRLPPPKDKLQSEPNSAEAPSTQSITPAQPESPVSAAPPAPELPTPDSCLLTPSDKSIDTRRTPPNGILTNSSLLQPNATLKVHPDE